MRSLLGSQELAESQCVVQRACGGCPLLGLQQNEQRAHKTELLRAAFERAALPWLTPAWVGDGLALGYRNRIRLRVEDGVPLFFNSNKQLTCAVLRSELRDALGRVLVWACQYRTQLRPIQHLEVRVPDADGQAALALYGASDMPPAMEREIVAPLGFVLSWPGQPPPSQRFQGSTGPFTLIPVTSFMQVNSSVNELLLNTVARIARESASRSALDLYCGAGNFSLQLLAQGVAVTAVEYDADALAALACAAAQQEFGALDVRALDAGMAVEQLVQENKRYELVVANPPRAGLGRAATDCARLAQRDMVLCCCKAQSFVRDAVVLVEAGLRLRELLVFDMFPGTEHMEVLGHFVR